MTATSDARNPALSGFQRRFAAKIEDEKQSNRSKLEPTAVPGFEQRFATKIAEEKRHRCERDAAAKATWAEQQVKAQGAADPGATRGPQACRSTGPWRSVD